MTMLFHELPEHLQRRIAADEQVLWCGKGRPTPFLRGFWPRMMAGCMAAAFLYWTFPDRVLAELAKGGENLSAFDVLPALVYSFFAAIDIWLLLTPLYYWILSLGTTWVVTNRSVTSFFGPFTHTWMRSEWLDPVRVETRGNGCSDFLFMERGLLITMKNRGEVKVEAGIENVPPEDAKQLTAIFDSFQNKYDDFKARRPTHRKVKRIRRSR